MRVLALVVAFLGGVFAKATKEAISLQKSGVTTELQVAQTASAAAKRDLYSARAEFDALVEEAQLPSGVQIPPGWVVVNTAPKAPVAPVATPAQNAPVKTVGVPAKVIEPPPVSKALVAGAGSSQNTVVSSGLAKVVVADQSSSVPAQTSRPAATPLVQPQKVATNPSAVTQVVPKPLPPATAATHALPQQQQQKQTQQQKQGQSAKKQEPAPAPCWDPSPAPAPAGGPGAAPAAADVKADELAGPHAKTPEDDYVPALEGVLVPPAGEAAPVTTAQAVVPPNTLSKIQSVECLEKTLENPEYKCAEHHYVGGAAPPVAAVKAKSTKETTGGATAADIEAINDAVKKAEHAAADAKAEAAMAEKYFNQAKEIADKVAKKEEAKPSSFLRHPTKHHHREHHEVTPSGSKHMPILIHAKSPVVYHDKIPQI